MFKSCIFGLIAALTLIAADKTGLLSKQELVKRKLSRMEGLVSDIGKFPVDEAAVMVQRLEDSGNTPLRVELKTSEDGKFVLDALAPGKYEVQASHKGFKPAVKRYSLQPGKVTQAAVSLSLSFR